VTDWSLYVIIDKEWLRDRPVEEIAERMIHGGVNIIQYRDKISGSGKIYKEALKLRKMTTKHAIPFIVNDRVDIAMAVGADGVHLGQNDLPLDAARRIAGKGMILGGSVHSLSEFKKMKDADYFGVGTIYATKTKPDVEAKGIGIVEEIRKKTDHPIVGIGGITPDNLEPVIHAGADGVAVISGILGAEDVEKHTRQYINAIQEVGIKQKRG
jgi:thiamine-phosphate pyrophosphorylase